MRRLLLVVALMLSSSAAAADDFSAGHDAEGRYAFKEAVDDYTRALAGPPAVAERAQRRIDALSARSEGEFVPLGVLSRARDNPNVDLEELVRAADEFPPGLVRCETWVFAADAYGRTGHNEMAVPLWRKAARDPKADAVLAHAAIRSAVDAHLAAGEVEQAGVDVSWFYDEPAAREIARVKRREALHVGSLVVLGLVFVWMARAMLVARGREAVRRSWRPIAGCVAYVGAGALLANGYAAGSAGPFLWFAVALAPILVGARAWGAAGGAPRIVRAAACAASVVAAAFLVLERTGHLDALGL
jgi:hypothetical protein